MWLKESNRSAVIQKVRQELWQAGGGGQIIGWSGCFNRSLGVFNACF